MPLIRIQSFLMIMVIRLQEEYLTSKNIESVTLANGGKVYYKDGIQYIEWTDQTIPNKNNNAEMAQNHNCSGTDKTILVEIM